VDAGDRDRSAPPAAAFLSAAGDLLALVTLAQLVHDLTRDGHAVSALFAATMLPAVALAPLAGRLVDRVETVRLLALTSLLAAGAATPLALAGDFPAILALTALVACIRA
jgi:MFS family permease